MPSRHVDLVPRGLVQLPGSQRLGRVASILVTSGIFLRFRGIWGGWRRGRRLKLRGLHLKRPHLLRACNPERPEAKASLDANAEARGGKDALFLRQLLGNYLCLACLTLITELLE